MIWNAAITSGVPDHSRASCFLSTFFSYFRPGTFRKVWCLKERRKPEMSSKIKQFTLRSLLIPVSGLFFLNEFELLSRSVNDIVFDFSYHLFGTPIYLTLNTRLDVVFAFFTAWMLLHVCLEAAAAFGSNFRFHRVLQTLRYAPLGVFFLATAVVIVYDQAMIEYSKRGIRNYVYNSSTSVVKPDVYLHNNYHGWRASGYPEQEKYLYFKTASEGIESENPNIRARSLLMSARIQDWNLGSDAKFENLLAKSCADSASSVRDTAENYLYRRQNSSCRKFLAAR